MLSYSGKVYSAFTINRRTAINSTPIFSQRTPAGARTLDTLIKSQVLYQLSYKRILAILFSVRLQGLEPWTP